MGQRGTMMLLSLFVMAVSLVHTKGKMAIVRVFATEEEVNLLLSG